MAVENLNLISQVAAILKKNGYPKAVRVITGTRRDGNRTANLYSWREGFLLSSDEGIIKLTHKMDYPWSLQAHHRIQKHLDHYLQTLEKNRIRSYLSRSQEIVIVEKLENNCIEAAEIIAGEIWQNSGDDDSL